MARRAWTKVVFARIILGVSLVLVVSACGVVGSGEIITEQREVEEFDRIDVSGGMTVDLLIEPSAAPEVTVTFDDNLLDRVVTRVSGGTLIIEFDGAVQFTGAGRFVAVIVPTLEALEASGGSDITGSGTGNAMRAQASGGSSIDLTDVTLRTAEVDASGGSDVLVSATDAVTGKASGGSEVTVSGNPGQVSIDTSGGSDVNLEN